MTAREIIVEIYAAAAVLGFDADTAAAWAGTSVALALEGVWGEA